MSRPKYETCRHSTGNVGELIVYVNPSCPNLSKIKGTLCSSKIRYEKCDKWEEKNEIQNRKKNY